MGCIYVCILYSLVCVSRKVVPQELHYLEMLGHGTSGTVYRSLHTPSKTIMAVKIIPLDATLDEQKKIMTELDILHKVCIKYGL